MADAQDFLTDPEDIYAAIQKLARAQSKVKVTFEGDGGSFHSAVTKLDFKSKLFAFDQIIPEHGNKLIKSGITATLNGEVQGVVIEFDVTGSLKFKPSTQEYIAQFPEKLLYLQRRDSYRSPVPRTYEVFVHLRSSDHEEEFKGRLTDISSSGFKAIFPKKNIAGKLKQIAFFDESTLHVGDEMMDCGIEARHAVFDVEKGYTWCGFHFEPLSGMKQRYVDQLVQRLQFEEKRKEEARASRKNSE